MECDFFLKGWYNFTELGEEDLMKKLLIPAVVLFSITFIFLGCSNEKAIEKIIGEFEDAVNSNNLGDFQDTISPDSEFYITGLFSNFLGHFDGQRNVDYPGLDISIDGDTADALSNATFVNGTFPIFVKFVTRKEGGFFSFLNPNWKILQYWEDTDDSGTFDESLNESVWKRLSLKKISR
jgi:hypothetical protein